jgi:hypothetical protein
VFVQWRQFYHGKINGIVRIANPASLATTDKTFDSFIGEINK